MKPIQPQISYERIDAAIALTLVWLNWLVHIVALIGEPCQSRTLIRWVRWIERKIELSIFAMAYKRAYRYERRGTKRPRSTPSGFRRQRSHSFLLLKTSGIRLRRGSLAARLASLQQAMRAPERFIERFLKRIRASFTMSRLVVAAPAAVGWFEAAACAPALADSS